MFWGKKEGDKSRRSEGARECLAVGTIMKIIWCWHLPIVISGIALFGMMFAALFRITSDTIAILTFFLFIIFFTKFYSQRGGYVNWVFVNICGCRKNVRKRYL
jgi:hypothetical protein